MGDFERNEIRKQQELIRISFKKQRYEEGLRHIPAHKDHQHLIYTSQIMMYIHTNNIFFLSKQRAERL
jgi:hypothetical protein